MKQQKQPLANHFPRELKRKINALAKESRREPDDVAVMCMEMGVDKIQDEPWFMAGVPQARD